MKLRVGSLSKNFIAPNLMKWKALFFTTEKKIVENSSFMSNKSKYFPQHIVKSDEKREP
jgi:hypothetical protein